MSKLTLGSLFDGSGGFPLGGLLCGIEPLWASEIEPFPIRVTTKRIPQMKHYGDISKLNGADLPPVDIITFGSPCTDMSVAGKRAGLDGGLENLGEKLMKSENFEMALDEIVWLITLLANQSILIRNLKNKNAPEELLTEEEVELLTSPLDLATYKNAITEAMFKGTKCYVESEEENVSKGAVSKNVEVG